MRKDFGAIPDAAGPRDSAGSVLARIYRDIGLAAVADALGLDAADFDDGMARSLSRGAMYIVPVAEAADIEIAA